MASGKLSRAGVAKAVKAAKAARPKKPRAERLVLNLEGVSVTFPAAEPLSWATLLATLERIRKEAKTLASGEKELCELAEVFSGR